jgi:hypothetical protein
MRDKAAIAPTGWFVSYELRNHFAHEKHEIIQRIGWVERSETHRNGIEL